MGREVKRVAAGFVWPLGRVWSGYVNPHWGKRGKCGECGGSGYGPRARALADQWYGDAWFDPASKGSAPVGWSSPEAMAAGERNADWRMGREPWLSKERAVELGAKEAALRWSGQWCHHLSQPEVDALVGEGRLAELTSDFVPGRGWVPKPGSPKPTAAEVNRWSLAGLGHDSINQAIVVRRACQEAGHEVACPECGGSGERWESAQAKADADAWEPSEPPGGLLWQVWETTSEGSPISPAFADPQDLAEWLSENRGGAIDEGTSKEEWLEFIAGPGWAPTMALAGGAWRTGVEASAREG